MALRHLSLRDFVIVDALELDLQEGFTALTGETGAGKSILIDALQLLLGSRADALSVRAGCARCELSAEFDTPAGAMDWLEGNGFDAARGDALLLLRRTIDASGKSRAWINGSPATATQLRELGDALVDIHGQHAWQSLTRPAAMRGLLDAYGRIDTQPLAQAWHAWRQADTQLQQAQARQETLRQEHERLNWQLGEIDKLAPQPGEWEEINARHDRLSHAQALTDAAQAASDALNSDDGGGALTLLAQARQPLSALAHVEAEFGNIGDVLASCLAEAQDAAHSLQTYLRHIEPDPAALEKLDARLSQWLSLARRFRQPPESLLTLRERWQADLNQLQAQTDLDALAAQAAAAQAAYQAAAQAVSAQRQKHAPQLAREITAAMQGLSMAGGQFDVRLDKADEPGPGGAEKVSFLVAGHAGTSPRPIEKVASGGELSRLALAITVTTSRLGQAPTLVFDEVDSGIGGSVANTVGQMLRQLGQDRQVLCVTHLAQVAACADHHWHIAKQTRQGQTVSSAAALANAARVQEIARMLGGAAHSAAGQAHALELLNLNQSGAPAAATGKTTSN
ncbi:MAG: DNA repair protein RecN [Burkholderiaceae bacterium]|nr:DNA repair protein RecN [Burkholderiaceae bacterium]